MATDPVPAPPPILHTLADDSSDSELSDPDNHYDTEPELLEAMGLSRDGSALPEKRGAESDSEDDGDEEEEWDAESFFEDAIEMMEEAGEGSWEGVEVCTAEERQELKALLKKSGEERFLKEVIGDRGMDVRRCLTAFGVRPPYFLEGLPDRHPQLIQFLRVVLAREMIRRQRIPGIDSVEHVVELLKKSKNIIVLTGAGISTSLGIPDFRSKGSGLYSRLESLGLSDPQEVFDIDVFTEDPSIFYSIAKDILPTSRTFSPTHAFIALLQAKDKLLTQYTQNIDNLETLAGIREDKLIQCHGSFATATCTKCGARVPGETIFPELQKGLIARCDVCLAAPPEKRKKPRKRTTTNTASSTTASKHPSPARPPHKKKRFSEDSSADEDEAHYRQAGVMKPDITFFGEQLPDTFHRRLVEHDRDKADLLICIGTSLKVAPVSEIIGFLPSHVPQIYISKTPVNHVEFDVELLGSCDEVVVELCARAGWELRHEMIPEVRRRVRIERVESERGENRFRFETVGP